jgi:Xaa-Pro dipeptidase
MLANDRRQRLAERMRAAGLDLMLVYGNAWQGDYLRYATDYAILEGEGLALVRPDGSVTLYLESMLEAERAEVEAPGIEVVHASSLLADVETVLARSGNAAIGAAPRKLLPRRLAARAKDLRIGDGTALIDDLLMNKLPSEVAAIRAAASMADRGYEVFRAAARPGRADYELIAEVENFYRANGVDDNFMIIGVGGPEVRGMAPPGGKRLKKGDLVTTELTPCVGGYYVQICRTLVVGEASAEQRGAFDLYCEAMEAGIATVRPGVTAADIARAENEIFRREGYGAYVTNAYTRVRGHGLGLFADTKPQLLEDVQTRIEAGMTLIVHPNTYHPVVGYFVLGDSLIVTEQGADVLTQTPRELFSVAA